MNAGNDNHWSRHRNITILKDNKHHQRKKKKKGKENRVILNNMYNGGNLVTQISISCTQKDEEADIDEE